jgi:hypothetical protein
VVRVCGESVEECSHANAYAKRLFFIFMVQIELHQCIENSKESYNMVIVS